MFRNRYRQFEFSSLRQPVRDFSDFSENRSKSARVRAEAAISRHRRTPLLRPRSGNRADSLCRAFHWCHGKDRPCEAKHLGLGGRIGDIWKGASASQSADERVSRARVGSGAVHSAANSSRCLRQSSGSWAVRASFSAVSVTGWRPWQISSTREGATKAKRDCPLGAPRAAARPCRRVVLDRRCHGGGSRDARAWRVPDRDSRLGRGHCLWRISPARAELRVARLWRCGDLGLVEIVRTSRNRGRDAHVRRVDGHDLRRNTTIASGEIRRNAP